MKWIPNLLSSQGLLYTSKDELEMRVDGLNLPYLYPYGNFRGVWETMMYRLLVFELDSFCS